MVFVVAEPGGSQGIISFHLNLISSVLCPLLSVNFHMISSLRSSLSAAVTQHTGLWFDRLRHIFFGMVKSSQGTPCNNGIRSASPDGLRITYHAALSLSSVDVKYHLNYPYVTCRFVQRCTRQNAPLPAAVLKSMHLIEEFLE
jgi:hypothetical protein